MTYLEVYDMDANKIVKVLETYVSQNESYKTTYFWTPPSSACGRRSMEFCTVDTIQVGPHEVYLQHALRASCKNVYFSKTYKVDGKTVTIRAIRERILPLARDLATATRAWTEYVSARDAIPEI